MITLLNTFGLRKRFRWLVARTLALLGFSPWRPFEFVLDDLPFTQQGLRLQRCGFKPNREILIEFKYFVSPNFPNQTKEFYTTSPKAKSDSNGCIDVIIEDSAKFCRDDPQATFEISFKYRELGPGEKDPDFPKRRYNCGGLRIR